MKITRIVFITMVLGTYCSFGQYLDRTAETNINKVDPLFERSMDDYNSFKQGIEAGRDRYVEEIKSSNGKSDLVGWDKINQEKSRLEEINVHELESRGRAEMAQEPFYNDMFIDYSKPSMQAHKEDAKLIAESSGRIISSLFNVLKEIGVNCKTVKGNIERDPEYFMEIERTPERSDTIYEQHFCERPKNHYTCGNIATVTCKVKGFKPGEWVDRSIKINSHDIHPSWLTPATIGEYHGRHDYWRIDYTRIREEDPIVQFHFKNKIADRLNILNKEQLGDPITAGYEKGRFAVRDVAYVNSLNFKYRELIPTCLEWQERWDETCKLEN